MARKKQFIARYKQLPSDGKSPAADMRQGQRARIAQSQAPLGTPPADFGVRSVYDSRPVSGYDFNQIVTVTNNGEASSAAFFIVPQGYVAVIREVLSWVEPVPVLPNNRSEISLILQINESDVPTNDVIPMGAANTLPFKYFAIADEFDKVGVRWEVGVLLADTLFTAHIYGNLLQKDGRPAQFEIANYAGAGERMPGMPSTIAPAEPRPVQQPAPRPAYEPPPPPDEPPPIGRRRVGFAVKRR